MTTKIVYSLFLVGMVITSVLGIIYLKHIGADISTILLAGTVSIFVITTYLLDMMRELRE